MNTKYYIRGGIGDLLQHYWYIKAHPEKEYIVHTHFKNAEDIFRNLGATNCHFYPFKDMPTHNEQVDVIKLAHALEDQSNILEVPRAYYSSFNFGEEANKAAENIVKSFPVEKGIIGIHPFRSGFATSVYNNFDLPAKMLPVDIVNSLINDKYNYLIYGSKEELSSYGIQERDNVKLVSCDNILHSLSTVKYCKGLVGLDSCFKSMSSMQGINTICIIGDFPDPVRDSCFVNKYVSDGVMKVLKTKNIAEDKDKIIELFSSQFI